MHSARGVLTHGTHTHKHTHQHYVRVILQVDRNLVKLVGDC
jgi:hypothetical protein